MSERTSSLGTNTLHRNLGSVSGLGPNINDYNIFGDQGENRQDERGGEGGGGGWVDLNLEV